MIDLQPYMAWIATLLLATARVAGLLLVAPVFSHSAVPARLRLLAAVTIGLSVASRLAPAAAPPTTVVGLAMGVACELLIGGVIGYAARLIFAGVELGAFQVSQQMGLALAEVIDPQKSQWPPSVGGLFQMLALVVFLAIGGLGALLGGLLDTFRTVPLGASAPGREVLQTVVGLLGASFVLALKVAAPVLIGLLLATVALGLLHRTVPQCSLLSIGLPVRVMLGLLVLAGTLVTIAPLMESAAGQLSAKIQALAGAVR